MPTPGARSPKKLSVSKRRAETRRSRARTQKELQSRRVLTARDSRTYQRIGQAKRSLGKLRQASAHTIALTSLVLLATETNANDPPRKNDSPQSSDISTKTILEGTNFLNSFSQWIVEQAPRFLIAVLILIGGWILNRLVTAILRRTLKSWHRAEAISALAGIGILLFSIGAALAAIAGDIRALLGSVGLVGLALSWALQTPIESFTGWLLNSFRVYYTVGDRIEVGDVFGDVFRIDILTTTVWQAGGPGQSVQAAQPTGALITFPNSEVLRSNIINYTRDFPYVWDEIHVGVSNDSDLRYSMKIVHQVAVSVFGDQMLEPTQKYEALLKERNMPIEINDLPSLFVHTTDSWTQIVVRYLVKARERRKRSTELVLAISEEITKPEHRGKIINGYPRSQVELLTLENMSFHKEDL